MLCAGHPDAKGLAANRSAAAGKPADSGLYHSQTPADTWKIGSLFQPTPPAHALHHSCNRYSPCLVSTLPLAADHELAPSVPGCRDALCCHPCCLIARQHVPVYA